MEYLKSFIEKKLTINERIKLIKELMDVDAVYEEIRDYILDDLEDGDSQW